MNSNLALSPTFTLISDNDFAQVWLNETTGEKALISLNAFKKGESLYRFESGEELSEPTYLTVQIDTDKHITLKPDFLQYINHSCNPNVFFDTTLFELVCVKDVNPGDELSFFYPSAEWDMAQPFACRCESPHCHKFIQGAAHIPKELLTQYKLTDFILKQINNL